MHTSTSTIRRAPIVLTVLLPIVMLAMPTIPAWADAADPAPIHMASSVRSFPKHLVPHRSFSEAVSTDVDGSWGGIETLDVPHTESPEEQATRSAAISSTSAQMMLTDLLFMALVQQDLERAPERIRHSEELVKKLV